MNCQATSKAKYGTFDIKLTAPFVFCACFAVDNIVHMASFNSGNLKAYSLMSNRGHFQNFENLNF